MAEFCFHSTLYLLFLIKFLSLLLLLSSPSSAAANFLINCGGPNVSLSDDWTFLADDTSSSSFSVKGGESIENSSILPSDTSPLYQTARIFHQPSYFELNIADIGNYLVRLHFFTFKSKKTDFSNAFFNVSGSNFTLLSNYSTENTAHLPVKKEFFLFINEGKFKIHFIPANKKSFAFINAIEVLHLPEDFLFDKNSNLNSIYPVPPLSGTLFKYTALNTLYRINVGGQKVNDADDLLRREWLTDDPYLIGGNISVRNHRYDGKLNQFPNATQIQDIAPDIVYKTCSYETTDNNITWRFDVRKEIMHLVRLHFCDIVSEVAGTLFDLYIYTKYRNVVDPYNDLKATTMAAPFFSDYVVKSDDSGHIDISVGINDASENKFAYLNGVEIMEFVTDKIKEPIAMDEHSSRKHLLIIGFPIGGVSLVLSLIILALLAFRHGRKGKKDEVEKDEVPVGKGRPNSWMTATTFNSSSPLPKLNLKLKMSLSEILAATENFDTKFLIGEGGFGKVYKGTLSSGKKVAVKRSDPSNGQGLQEFQTEVMVLSKIRHRHLVSLIGYCDEGEEMILVYEFLEKGTLRDHLYSWKENSKNTHQVLTWKQRLEICIGAATGLHYLHTGSDWEIIHRDVKSTNILLDEYCVAKVADFGLSQSGPPDRDHCRMGLIGSFGYLDPEYLLTFQLTAKSDVYSFGVVLLEVLCARPPIISSNMNLAEWGMLWLNKGQLEKITDPSLAGQINPNSLRKFGEIVEKCLKKEGASRPTMLDVRWDLEYVLQLQRSALHREPHEDTTTDISSNYVFPDSSNSFPNQEDCGCDDHSLEARILFING